MIQLQLDGYEQLLQKLERIEAAMSRRAVQDALRAAARIIEERAKQLCPAAASRHPSTDLSGHVLRKGPRGKTFAIDPRTGTGHSDNDGSEKKPLRETIGTEVRDYGDRQLALVGPQYPAGAHGHLVEFGHAMVVQRKVVGFVAGRPFMRPAFEETKSQQLAAIEHVLRQALEEAAGN